MKSKCFSRRKVYQVSDDCSGSRFVGDIIFYPKHTEENSSLDQLEDIITDLDALRATVCELYETLLVDDLGDEDEA